MHGMIHIPAETVRIGAPEPHLDALVVEQHYARAWFEDESPQHARRIDAFWIDRAPVTNVMFAEFVDDTGHVTAAEHRGFGLVYGPEFWIKDTAASWRTPAAGIDAVGDRPNHPVVHVDHTDASTYAAWAGKRLPTEAEWEYAAHGPDWTAWPWGSDWNRLHANTVEHWAGEPIHDADDWQRWWKRRYDESRTAPGTTPVGSFSPVGDSPFGVTDLAGNVAEWTADTYTAYDPGRAYSPQFEQAMRAGFITVRGGSWKHFRYQTRTSERIACTPTHSCFDLGFRCARTAITDDR